MKAHNFAMHVDALVMGLTVLLEDAEACEDIACLVAFLDLWSFDLTLDTGA